MNARRLILGTFCATLAVVVCSAAPAFALKTHAFSTSFSGSGANALSDPQGVAIDQSTGEVYVVDSAHNRVEIFNSSGTFISAFGTAGSGNGQFNDPTQVTVDNSGGLPGDVYVLDAGNERVEVFNAGGQYQSQITQAALSATHPPVRGAGSFQGVAVDASGNLWVYDSEANMYEFSSGALPASYRFNTSYGVTPGLAIDSSGDFFVLRGVPDVEEFQPGGTDFAEFDLCGCATAVAADPASGDVYVDQGSSIAHFLAGNSSGTPDDSFGAGGPDALAQGAGVAAKGSTGAVYVADAASNRVDIFTAVTLPDTALAAPTGGQPTAITLNGTVNPVGEGNATCQFEYGTSSAYGQTAACSAGIPSGNSPVPVTADLAGLAPNTTYHYRLDATNGQGTNYTEDSSFTTLGPPTIVSESGEADGQTSVTLRAQINPGGVETQYRFEYGPTTSYGTSVPIPDGTIPAGFAEESVSVELTGLEVGATYHFRVVATNADSPSPIDSSDQTVTTVPAALVLEAHVTEVTAESATLHSYIQPLGNDTHYYFQYGTSSCSASPSACTDAPSPPGTDMGIEESYVSQHLQGLASHTIYHYRAVASNVLGTSYGAEATLTTQLGGGGELVLPDGRAWELVSPPTKNGARITPIGGGSEQGGGVVQTAQDGGAITYLASAPIGEPAGNNAPDLEQIYSARGAGGWSTQTITTPRSQPSGVTEGIGGEYQLFSSDMARSLVEPPTTFLLSPEASEGTLYQRDDVTGDYLPLVSAANTPPGAKLNEKTTFGGIDYSYDLHFAGASPDANHVVLESAAALTANAASSTSSDKNLYEWSAGQLRLVSMLPNGKPADVEGHEAFLGRSGVDTSEFYNTGRVTHAVSSDGSLVVWNDGVFQHLYIRDTAREETLQIDLAQGAPEPSDGEAVFQLASDNGSRIIFADGQKLTADSTANGRFDGNLYAFELTSGPNEPLAGKLVDLTAAAPHAGTSVVGASEDASYVYTPGYLLHYTGTHWTGTLVPASIDDSNNHEGHARVSPNGRYFAFETSANRVELYDANTDRVVCVSCNSTGEESEATLPGWTLNGIQHAVYQSRALSDSGRLFFETSAALVPQDTNGQQTDVYEYEPQGIGDCESPVTTFNEALDGCVGLISSGTSSEPSSFLDASESGDDVFFLTKQPLVSQDYDTAADVYDAHVCSAASPCSAAPVSSPACTTADSCRTAPSPQPSVFGASGSATFAGAGNLAPLVGKPAVKAKTKSLTRAQKLARALKSCRQRDRSRKGARAVCEAQARKQYGAKKKPKRSKASKSLSARTRR